MMRFSAVMWEGRMGEMEAWAWIDELVALVVVVVVGGEEGCAGVVVESAGGGGAVADGGVREEVGVAVRVAVGIGRDFGGPAEGALA